jgi:hypothetical protein
MFMAMLIFDMIIVYAVDVFDGISPVKSGWVLKDKTQRLLFFTHPSIPSQEGIPQIPLLRGVWRGCSRLFLHPHRTSPIKGEELIV